MATFVYWNEHLFGESSSRGKFFDFGENTADDDDDEMASHCRAVLQSQDHSTPTPYTQPLASHPLPGTSAQTSFPLSTTSTHNLSYSSTHWTLARSDAEVSSPSVTPHAILDSPRTTRAPLPMSAAQPRHLSITTGASAPISAPQPGSIHLVSENGNEDRDVQDTASDSDTTPPASAFSQSPNPILATSMTPSDNDSELVQQFHAHLSLVDTQPSVSPDGSSIALGPSVGPGSSLNTNHATQPQVVRRGRPAGRVPRTSKQAPGPSRSSSRQVTVAAAPTEIRSRLRTRTNALGRS
ncbi:hypothetical protein AGABI1DRAFT_91102 [Agaricus bisporus var. burnettii JB137-S8]|uniref:Uncharacterized protein n=1 Tax=Agaricus bisporus var. burnettii (strain JB137-S8 / ATCC MYA-4627 / FGSC 10392) TaxID=597362 RepID=K5Y0T7_AGABU|nr:uncharacterized protein AGABI1DRAFT_91102 [Agaricus bisporus var. burnettii JB137-S8]EKM81395.1 hypothetical protein AGABI1DRAFT_91102 [Agaricus bisporus var. burnettii JB137-S8]